MICGENLILELALPFHKGINIQFIDNQQQQAPLLLPKRPNHFLSLDFLDLIPKNKFIEKYQ